MLLSTQFALRKAAAVARGLPETVGESLRYVQGRLEVGAVGSPYLRESDVAAVVLLASAPSAPVAVAGLQAAALFASLRGGVEVPLDVGAASELLGAVARCSRDPEAAVRSAAVSAVEWLLAVAPVAAGEVFVCSCTELAVGAPPGGDSLCDWQAQEAAVMALAVAVRSRGGDELLRPVLARCALGVVLPACGEAPSKYVRSAAMHLCASVVEVWSPHEVGSVGDASSTESAAALVSEVVAAVAGGDGGREARFGASVALRAVVRRWPVALLEEPLCSRLLPPLVLGRYYGPERQRLYCVGTWKLLVGELATVVGSSEAAAALAVVGEPRPPTLLARASSPGAGCTLPVPLLAAGHSELRPTLVGQRPSPPEVERSASPSRSRSLSCALLDSQLLAEGGPSGRASPSAPAVSGASLPLGAHLGHASPAQSRFQDGGSASGGELASAAAAASSSASGIGPALVAKHISEIAAFYLRQCAAVSDPDAREAAAHCIAELTSKVDAAAVRPFAAAFLEHLHGVCADRGSGWSARDAAAVAAAKVAIAFPDAMSLERVDDTAGILAAMVGDDHRTVRDHAAVSLVDLSRAFPRLSSFTASTATAAVASPGGRVSAEEADLGWCRVAGASCLLRELAAVDAVATADLLRLLLVTLSLPEAPLWPREALFRALPELCTGLGKQATKRLLDEVLSVLCTTASACSAPLRQVSDCGVSYAVSDAAAFLRSFVGRSIFDGHLSPAQADCLARASLAGGRAPEQQR